jgi:hypothetical protein
MADPECVKLGIPGRLHKEGKEPDEQFEKSEWLYRWIGLSYEREDLIAAFRLLPWESINRDKHSKYPADVLFNIVNGKHRVGFAILAFQVTHVQRELGLKQNDEEVTYSFRVRHKPERRNARNRPRGYKLLF